MSRHPFEGATGAGNARGGKRRMALALSVVAGLAGCDVAQDYKAPEATLAEEGISLNARQNVDLTNIRWWTAFGDATLNTLVDEGLTANTDLKIALERVTEAEALSRAAGLTQNVDATVSATAQGARGDSSSRVAAASLGLSLLLDPFGRSKNQKLAALARVEAAEAGARNARLTYIATLTQSYITLRGLQERRRLTVQDQSSRRQTIGQIDTLLNVGAATRLDSVQAQALLLEGKATLPTLDLAIDTEVNRIATLMGIPADAYSSDTLRKSRGIPIIKSRNLVSIDADLLRNRPDLIQLERLYRAAVADLGAAEANRYPSLELSGTITPRINGADTWSFGPVLDIPLFDQGQRIASRDAAASRATQAYLTWKSQVLTAVEEVQTALAVVSRRQAAVSASSQVVAARREGRDLSFDLARNQEITQLDLLDAERQLSQARQTLAENRQSLALAQVQLNTALGAGSDVRPAVEIARASFN